jgi:hypothetical protein
MFESVQLEGGDGNDGSEDEEFVYDFSDVADVKVGPVVGPLRTMEETLIEKFKSEKDLTDRDLGIIAWFNGHEDFDARLEFMVPVVPALPYDFSFMDLFCLVHRGLTWRDKYKRKVLIHVPNMGIPYASRDLFGKLNFQRFGYPGGDKFVHTRFNKIDGVSVPVIRVGTSAYVVSQKPLRISRCNGYQGDFMERVGRVYYGVGRCQRLEIGGMPVPYVDIASMDITDPHVEGSVFHYDLNACKFVETPTIDLQVQRNKLVDEGGTMVYTVDHLPPALRTAVRAMEEGLIAEISACGDRFIRTRSDKVLPNRPEDVKKAQQAPLLSGLNMVQPRGTAWHLDEQKFECDKEAYLRSLTGLPVHFMVVPPDFVPPKSEVTHRVLWNIVLKHRTRRFYWRSTQFLRAARKIGLQPHFQCLIRFLRDTGLYRVRGVWRFKVLVYPLRVCPRALDWQKVCTCDWRIVT